MWAGRRRISRWAQNAVWVVNQSDGTVSRIDPTSARLETTIKVGGTPNSIAVGDGLVWVTFDSVARSLGR
jgi:YVTN family beta-propeller protein